MRTVVRMRKRWSIHMNIGERMNNLRRGRGQSRPQRHTATTHRQGRAVVSESDEEFDERTVLGSR
jgi:hypothetical protein